MIFLAVAVVSLLVALAVVVYLRGRATLQYVTAPVIRTSLVQTVTASGTVNPQNLILVGTQVSGTISELDVDYNSPVRIGQVMAKIDPTTFRDSLAGATASAAESASQSAAGAASAQNAVQNVATAQQNAVAARMALASAASQVAKGKTALSLAGLTLARDKQLLASGYIAQNQADADASARVAAQAAYSAALLAVREARAQSAAAGATVVAGNSLARSAGATANAEQAAVGISGAQVAEAAYSLKQSVIVSPVRGTVIARNVSIGQTVAASFTTPTLFSIAQDLSKMEVDIAAGEPDVGGIRAGEIVDFTVLAFPNRTFSGAVYQVRRNPTTVNNVVTYDTVVYVQNGDGALFPGMTANASIQVAHAANALVVPLQALQYAPPAAVAHPTVRVAPSSPWGATTASLGRTIVAGRIGHVYVLQNGAPSSVAVRIVLVSGTQAAVAPVAASLGTSDRLVIGDSTQNVATKAAAPASSLVQPAGLSRSASSH